MNNITRFWDTLFGGLPDVVVAILVLILALVVAWLAKFLTLKLLKVIGLERGMSKAGVEEKNTKKVTGFIGRLVYLIVFILFLPGIFEKLGLNNVAAPIVAMMNGFMAYLPNIIGAIIIAMVGLFIARLVKELLKPLLDKTKLNSFVEKTGLDVKKVDVSKILVSIVYTVIAVFFVVEALNTLKLEILTNIGNQIISYLPFALSAAIVMLIAYLLGNWVENALVKNFSASKATALIAKIAIIVIGVFMMLYQLGIAVNMVNIAFIIVLGSFGVAFAVAFGIGGREFASHTMRKFEQKLDENSKNRKK
ncbi:hypothetical protein IJG78_03335 [Candidatus Saccharibacteria bacterium]|nr:hypothetical protein [Candidatus Saccharibacteria bacterium]